MAKGWFRLSLSAVVAVGYILLCLLIQSAGGAWTASYSGHADEPAHFVGAVMLRDWLVSSQWLKPMQFAENYYSFYPFFAIGCWPPGFYTLTAMVFLVFGVGRFQAVLLPGLFAAGTAWLIFRTLRRRMGAVPAICVGSLYLALPETQRLASRVMVDHMTTFFAFGSALLLIRYLADGNARAGILSAIVSACAIMSKYSAFYLAVLPWAAVVFTRRFNLFRRWSFWVQPVILVLLVAPWYIPTRHLVYDGFASEPPDLTLVRAGAQIGLAFSLFTPWLLGFVAAGLGILLVKRTNWGLEAGVLGLMAVGQLGLVFLSPVGGEQRMFLTVGLVLLVLAGFGWGAMLELVVDSPRWRRLAQAGIVAGTATFLLFHAGRYAKSTMSPIATIVESVVEHRAWKAEITVVPSDLEGPFIAEFVEREHPRPARRLARPGKIFAESGWLGDNYLLHVKTPEAMDEFFDRNASTLVIWHERPAARQSPHERVIGEMLQRFSTDWEKVATFSAPGDTMPSWAIYRRMGANSKGAPGLYVKPGAPIGSASN